MRSAISTSSIAVALLAAGCGPAGGAPPELPVADYALAAALGPPIEEDPVADRLPIVQATGARVVPHTPPRAPAAAQVALRPAGGWAKADASAKTTVAVLDAGKLGHDPQVAVGERFLIVYTAHRYRVHDKATGAPLAADAAGIVEPSGDFNTIFLPIWAARDVEGKPNPASINLRMGFSEKDPLSCDPEAPTKSNACVQEFYDTRIMWDGRRKRFWIESAVRNHLWKCRPGDPCTGEKQSNAQARRYIAIAVSKTEDPRQGFFTYVLVDEYADWPKFAVNERYVVLSHRTSPNVYVFDADRLAAGNPDRGPVRLAKLDARHFPGARFIAPVTHHGDTKGITLLLGSDGSDRVVPFALVNADPDRAVRPVIVPGQPVSIGEKMWTLEGNAVYRDGALSWGFDEWVPGLEKDARQIRVFRMPVRLAATAQGPRLWSSSSPSGGFRSVLIGGREGDDAEGDVLDYEKPALDVNAEGDTVVVFARKGYRTRAPVHPEVRYAIVRREGEKAEPAVLLRRGTTSAVPDINDNGRSGIDLAYAQVDPSDERTVWVTHAWADAGVRWWRQVVAAVRP